MHNFKSVIIVLLFANPYFGLSQNFWQNTFISLSITPSAQDNRMFESIANQELIANRKKKIDFGFSFSIQSKIYSKNQFQSFVGIGYSLFHSTFPRPFLKHLINDYSGTEEYRVTKQYFVHKVFLPIHNEFYLYNKKNIYALIDILPSAEFNRTIFSGKQTFSKSEWDINSISGYLGLGIILKKRIKLEMSYRALFMNKIDKITFNELLWAGDISEEFQKKFEFYNPFQLMFSVNYILGKNTE